MHGSIRRYRVRSGSVNDIIQKVKDELLPLLEKEPGFIAYYIVNAESNRTTSFTVGEDHDAVERMTRTAMEWVRQNLPDRLGEPEVIAGPLPVATVHQHV